MRVLAAGQPCSICCGGLALLAPWRTNIWWAICGRARWACVGWWRPRVVAALFKLDAILASPVQTCIFKSFWPVVPMPSSSWAHRTGTRHGLKWVGGLRQDTLGMYCPHLLADYITLVAAPASPAAGAGALDDGGGGGGGLAPAAAAALRQGAYELYGACSPSEACLAS